ncbi:hypothetical protein ASE57_10990 [Sphingomonas sp. Leaf11]|nr:hypothetical protein ASE58_10985 [Sphingomonas sp. Leaf9]KQM42680.1 hypothetical protein ASE57_10990 [Sphingomonas sp. Leaf11]
MNKLVLAALLMIATPAYAQVPGDGLATFLKTKMQQERIPALQVAVVQRGKIVASAAYGVADVEHGVPATTSSIFSINSCTKAFTGVAIMQLAEAGKLRTDDPVSQYLDDLPQAWRAITIRQVLSHVSGLPNIIGDKEQVIGDGTEASAWAAVKKLPLEFKAGERYRYNQTGYVMLGRVIEKLGGMPFAAFIEKNQFAPAGMMHTRFGDSSDVVPLTARSYSYLANTDGVWRSGDRLMATYATFPGYFRTAAGILSTADDVARWLIALQSGKLLKDKASVAALWTPVVLNDGTTAGTNELLNGSGLGWPVTMRTEHPAAGPIGGMRSAFFVYPKDDLSVVVLTNLQGANPEYFIDEVAAYYIPGMHEADGFGLPSAVRAFRAQVLRRGFAQAPRVWQSMRAKPSEAELNAWGYKLREQEQSDQALAIFRLNVANNPGSWNAHDSLAEVLEAKGDRAGAIKHYRRSLSLNPGNGNAVEHLKELEASRARLN